MCELQHNIQLNTLPYHFCQKHTCHNKTHTRMSEHMIYSASIFHGSIAYQRWQATVWPYFLTETNHTFKSLVRTLVITGRQHMEYEITASSHHDNAVLCLDIIHTFPVIYFYIWCHHAQAALNDLKQLIFSMSNAVYFSVNIIYRFPVSVKALQHFHNFTLRLPVSYCMAYKFPCSSQWASTNPR